MAIETTIYSPRTLGKLITRMPPVHTFFRDTLFKKIGMGGGGGRDQHGVDVARREYRFSRFELFYTQFLGYFLRRWPVHIEDPGQGGTRVRSDVFRMHLANTAHT